ncbi:MAG: hypothetical protein JWP66_1909 [Naasia sp.]|nr:hypothetical protein [Naasia sp.]
MVCEGQVLVAVTTIFALDARATGTWAWAEPDFTCTYDIKGEPLTLTVHDVEDPAAGEQYFADLKASLPNVTEIEGMAGLGMPSFSTPEGIVAFLRDGKTLTVDATALPDGLGASGTRNREQSAYNLASAVLACWVQHDTAGTED